MYIDRKFTSLEEALTGLEIPSNIRETLALVDVNYLSFDGNTCKGKLVLHEGLTKDIQAIFEELIVHKFPIEKVIPIVAYNWDDEASMQDNNTSAFNYRRIISTDRLSNHSYGHAVDINPKLNPYYARDGRIHPQGVAYDPTARGTILSDGDVVRIFKKHDWVWYGERPEHKDYQHFQKII